MCDAYIRNLTQKYRLVVAIAVLKEKPEDISIENYIKDLENKVNEDKMDDLNHTVCSDDFDMEDPTAIEVDTTNAINSVTILKDYEKPICNDVAIEDDSTHIRNVISENINIVTMNNSNKESHAKDQASKNLVEIANASDLETTFCETQDALHTFPNLNQVYGTNYDTIKSNEASKQNDNVLNEVNRINTSDNTYYDSQATESYNLHSFTQNYTHVSQSQNYEQFVISDKFLKAKNNIQPYTSSDYNIVEIGHSSNRFQSNSNPIQLSKNDTEMTVKHTIVELNENNILTNDKNINTTENELTAEINESFPQYAQDFNVIDISQNTTNIVSENSKTNKLMNEIDENSTETQIVTFKVVEELNKVKNYVNKKVQRRMSNDGSVDSGYRSDSQSKCSFKSSLQLSGNWLNQSAHSLYDYITRCPLLNSSHEIIEEISQVLGQLINKLHEDEKYPSFLDELLENVNNLLDELLQESDGEDVLLRKDEIIQRLLLLNKSVHIQKYTIEKITSILENTLCHLTNPEETYEASNISEIENISYVFHLLEVTLQRYIKEKGVLSQETTNSQIEIKRKQIENKSSLTELWRKKWNPNYKEDYIEEFTPRKCVLIKCNEVLNKFVVSCIDGYSLVAFAALSCFNMLQS